MHSHPYAKTSREIAEWVRNMDEVGVEKTIILTMATGAEFDEINRKYSKYPDRFEMWCGFDFSGSDKPGFGPAAVKELERCRKWEPAAWVRSTIRAKDWDPESRKPRGCTLTIHAWIRCGKNVANSVCR